MIYYALCACVWCYTLYRIVVFTQEVETLALFPYIVLWINLLYFWCVCFSFTLFFFLSLSLSCTCSLHCTLATTLHIQSCIKNIIINVFATRDHIHVRFYRWCWTVHHIHIDTWMCAPKWKLTYFTIMFLFIWWIVSAEFLLPQTVDFSFSSEQNVCNNIGIDSIADLHFAVCMRMNFIDF